MRARRFDIVVDVTHDVDIGEPLHVAATVVMPHVTPVGDTLVFFGLPGGGYNRTYFDLVVPDRDGYSQADFHAAAGAVTVCIDHLGVGGSSVPSVSVDYEAIARAHAATVRHVSEVLRSGGIGRDVPPVGAITGIGMGQSYGGLLLTVLQADHGVFDGVAFLGWSNVQQHPVTVEGVGLEEVRAYRGSGLGHPWRRGFHLDDVPDEIVEADLRGFPNRYGDVPSWAGAGQPGGPSALAEPSPLAAGVVAAYAARIRCPVLIVHGEIDHSANPHQEPVCYPESLDVTTVVLPGSSHMHNFSGARELLWRRMQSWASGV